MPTCPVCFRFFLKPGVCPEDQSALIQDDEACRQGIFTPIAGRYVPGVFLGERTLGVVYEAEHPLFGNKVELKLLLPEYREYPVLLARFQREVQVLQRLSHPNIVTLLDSGALEDGTPFLVQERLLGRTLAEIIEQNEDGPLPVSWVLQVALQISDALQAVHAQGIAHGSVTPTNIFVLEEGEEDLAHVKLTEFDVATLPGDTRLEEEIQKAGVGIIIGTPAYMSPEQIHGNPFDTRSDIYTLGVILYEMLCGQNPFLDNTYLKIFTNQLQRVPPPLKEAYPHLNIPAELDDFLQKALQKQPEHRVSSMAEVREVLSSLLEGTSSLGSGEGAWNTAREELPEEDHPTPLSPSDVLPGNFLPEDEERQVPTQEFITQEFPASLEGEAPSPQEPLQRLFISDEALFTRLGGYVEIGKAFVFLGPGLFSQPGFSWLSNLLPEGPPRPYVLSSLETSAVLLPGATLLPCRLSGLSLAQLSCDRLLYREGIDEVRLFLLDLLCPGVEETLVIQKGQAVFARHTVSLNAHGAGALSLPNLPRGAYEAYLEGRPTGPVCRFTVAAPDIPLSLLLASPPPSPSAEVSFSTLGQEVVGSLSPLPGSSPVRGVYLEKQALCDSPLSLERVDTRKARLIAHTEVESVVVVVIDPTYPFPKPDALDRESARKICEEDRFFHVARKFFEEGKISEALTVFTEARAAIQSQNGQSAPPPLYAYYIARCHARRKEPERALAWIRTALSEGFDDLSLLSSEEDLSPLRRLALYQALLSGGRREIKAERLAEGESLEIEAPAPVTLLAVGAYVHQKPWEGWSAILHPEPFVPRIEASEPCQPGKTLTLRIETENAKEATTYLLVRDARLPSVGSPQEQLAKQILSFLWRANQSLSALSPASSPPVWEEPPVGQEVSLEEQDTPTPTPLGSLPREEDIEETIPVGEASRPSPQAPRVLYAGLVSLEQGEVKIPLPEDTPEGEYLAEAFLVEGTGWALGSARFQVGPKEREEGS